MSSCEMVSSTSRESEVMIGVIMIARMIPAVMKLAPLTGPPKTRLSAGKLPSVFAMCWYRLFTGCVNTARAQKP